MLKRLWLRRLQLRMPRMRRRLNYYGPVVLPPRAVLQLRVAHLPVG
jgi:hypothetical protein